MTYVLSSVALCLHCLRLSHCRFIQDMLTLLQVQLGVSTLKQFQCVKFDDFNWDGIEGGKKVFMRMAVKKLKSDGLGELTVTALACDCACVVHAFQVTKSSSRVRSLCVCRCWSRWCLFCAFRRFHRRTWDRWRWGG